MSLTALSMMTPLKNAPHVVLTIFLMPVNLKKLTDAHRIVVNVPLSLILLTNV
jgi:hypothetical protein